MSGARVTDFVLAHLSQDISLEALAQQIGFSPYYFARLFRREETTYLVLNAFDALAALDLIRTSPPHLVLLDYSLFGMDGLACLDRRARCTPWGQ